SRSDRDQKNAGIASSYDLCKKHSGLTSLMLCGNLDWLYWLEDIEDKEEEEKEEEKEEREDGVILSSLKREEFVLSKEINGLSVEVLDDLRLLSFTAPPIQTLAAFVHRFCLVSCCSDASFIAFHLAHIAFSLFTLYPPMKYELLDTEHTDQVGEYSIFST
ncbi:hypothetical protein ADUPG1_002430, partial [Aduncisulcus paluster]